MSGLLGGSSPKTPAAVAPAPQVDDATARLNEADKAARRVGRRSTILTGDNGLPDLGSSKRVQE